MILGNFLVFDDNLMHDTQGTIIFIVVFLLLAILLIITVFVIMNIQKNRSEYSRVRLFQSDRIFIVNFKDQIVDFFDFNNLRKIQTISFIDFLNFFPDSEQSNVRNYITELLNLSFDERNEDAICVTNINISYNKKRIPYRAIIKCKEVDIEKQIVYLETTRLIHIPVEHHSPKKNAKHDIYELGVVKKMYDDGRFNRGSMFVFRFYLKPNTVAYYNEYALRYFLINAVYSITNNNVTSFFFSGDRLEFALLDNRQVNDYQLSRFAFDMIHQIDKFLNIRGLSDFYDYNVCGSQVSDLPLYYDDAYETLDKLFKTAKAINRKFSTYKTDMNESSIIESTYKIELNRLIKSKDFVIEFAPYVHVTNTHITTSGYISFVNFNSNLIDNPFEVYKYAREFNLINEVISLICRKTISTYVSQCSDIGTQKLFVQICYSDIDSVVNVISHISKSNLVKIVLVIRSIDFIDIENNPTIDTKFKEVRDKGFEIAVAVQSKDYVLKAALYYLFDYILFDAEIENNVKIDSRNYIKAKSIIDNLGKFGKEIIVINVPSIQAFELISQSGIKNYSGDIVAKKDRMVLPVDSKVNKKILDLIK